PDRNLPVGRRAGDPVTAAGDAGLSDRAALLNPFRSLASGRVYPGRTSQDGRGKPGRSPDPTRSLVCVEPVEVGRGAGEDDLVEERPAPGRQEPQCLDAGRLPL